MSRVKTFGLEIVLPSPILSRAVNSTFKIPVDVLLKRPIPLVALAAGKLEIASVELPKFTALLRSAPCALPVLAPPRPPATFPNF